MLDFWGREHLDEGVGNHVICRAEYESNFAIIDYPAYEMKMDVDLLGVHVILMVLGGHNGRLIVREEGDGLIKRDNNFSNKRAQPQCLFHGVHCGKLLTFGH